MKIKSKDMAELIAHSVLMDVDICPTFPIRFHPPIKGPGRRGGWPWPDPPKPFRDRLEQLIDMGDSFDSRRAAGLIGGLLVDHLFEASKSIQYMEKNDGIQAFNRLSADVISISGECGTVPIREVIRRIMKLLGLKYPPSPDPDPNPVYKNAKLAKTDLLIVHSVIAVCAIEFENNASIAVVNASMNEIESLLK